MPPIDGHRSLYVCDMYVCMYVQHLSMTKKNILDVEVRKTFQRARAYFRVAHVRRP